MTPDQAQQNAGLPLFYVGDGTFRWTWYDGDLVAGFAKARDESLRLAWVVQQSGRVSTDIQVGEERHAVERLHGRAKLIPGLEEPRIRFISEEGQTLDVVFKDERVTYVVLSLPDGVDPDINLTAAGPGALPTFKFLYGGAVSVFPAEVGTTRVYSGMYAFDPDLEGWHPGVIEEKIVASETTPDGRQVILRQTLLQPRGLVAEPWTLEVDFCGDLVFTGRVPFQPASLYVGLEWWTGTRYVVTGKEEVPVPAGVPSEAFMVRTYNSLGFETEETAYYAPGVGLVKQGPPNSRQLVSFTVQTDFSGK